MNEPPIQPGADGIEARPRKTGQSRLDLALACSAIFISGVSLFVAIEHGKTERDLVAASSWLRQATVDPAVKARFNDALRELSFRACFCSVFDECWTTTLVSIRATAVKMCPARAVHFDPNGGR
jgi:hypothetical protein